MADTAYIAAPFPCREQAIRLMRMLERQGIEVTSSWLKAHDANTDFFARQDLADVARAALLVAVNPRGWEERGTGGRHVEFGYALALGKPILLVGERSNIFHHLSSVKVVDDTEDITKHVKRLLYESASGTLSGTD